MRAIVLAITGGVSLAGSWAHFDAPAIKRIETVSATNLQAPVSIPYVAPGQSKEYFFYGPWLDNVDKVTFLGTSQAILEKKSFLGTDGALVRVRLTAPAGTSRGERDLTLHIGCPPIPFTDCVTGNITRKAMVLRVGTVSLITPSSGVVAGTPTQFIIYGTGLDVATFVKNKTLMTSTTMQSRTSTSFSFTGTPVCGSSVVMLRDQAEGGDFYPYSGVATVSSSTQCGYQAPASTMSGPGSCPKGQVYNATSKTCVAP